MSIGGAGCRCTTETELPARLAAAGSINSLLGEIRCELLLQLGALSR